MVTAINLWWNWQNITGSNWLWVPGRMRVDGNEVADQLARQGSSAALTDISLPLADLQRLPGGDQGLDEQKRWASAVHSWQRQAKCFIRRPSAKKLGELLRLSRNQLRIMTGLFWFQTFTVFWMFFAFFWVIPRHLNSFCQRFGTHCLFHLQRKCYETLAYKIQMPGNYPEESIQQWQGCYQVTVIKKFIYLSWGLGTVLSMTDANRHLQWPHIFFVTVTL